MSIKTSSTKADRANIAKLSTFSSYKVYAHSQLARLDHLLNAVNYYIAVFHCYSHLFVLVVCFDVIILVYN